MIDAWPRISVSWLTAAETKAERGAFYVRKQARMPAIQPSELQGILQSKALRFCPSRQRMPEEEKAETET
jgi:hypothetical protein